MASKKVSKRLYKAISPAYDFLDKTYFAGEEMNPRETVSDMIPDGKYMVLDMCCGTFANGFVIAKNHPESVVVGLDRSKPMLSRARQKVKVSGLQNVKLICRDATDTGLKSEMFDYINIGLVLHECDPTLWKAILSEAHRLLKKDGRLIVLDWDRKDSIMERIKFSPMHLVESIGTPKYYKEYFYSDKKEFFSRYGFEAERTEKCKYTFVMSFKKADIPEKDVYTDRTSLLDYDNYMIQQLIEEKGWKNLPEFERIRAIYNFVRDEILFGYNSFDDIPASHVLRDGYGQCNTKGTLFMALLRACDIPCRSHCFTIDKKLQEGAMTGFVYRNAPNDIFHSWVEVLLEGTWYELEAFILDKEYLGKLQAANPDCAGAFCGYGVAVSDFRNPVIDFDRNDTYIQSEGINRDYGVFDSPDEMFKAYPQKISLIKKIAFKYYGRHAMNRNVKRIRGCR